MGGASWTRVSPNQAEDRRIHGDSQIILFSMGSLRKACSHSDLVGHPLPIACLIAASPRAASLRCKKPLKWVDIARFPQEHCLEVCCPSKLSRGTRPITGIRRDALGGQFSLS